LFGAAFVARGDEHAFGGDAEVVAPAGEQDTLAVRGPAFGRVAFGMETDLGGFAAGGGHDEEVRFAEAVRGEGDLLAVRREAAPLVDPRVAGERGGLAASGRNAPDVRVPAEHQRFSVRRQRRHSRQSHLSLGGSGNEQS